MTTILIALLCLHFIICVAIALFLGICSDADEWLEEKEWFDEAGNIQTYDERLRRGLISCIFVIVLFWEIYWLLLLGLATAGRILEWRLDRSKYPPERNIVKATMIHIVEDLLNFLTYPIDEVL